MTETADDLKTAFLPVERASAGRLRAQVQTFAEYDDLDQVLSAVPDMVMVLNAQRQIVYANRIFLDFTGYDALDDVIGMRVGEALGCIHAFERERECGTTPFCRYCGSAQAVMASLHGKHAVQECHISTAAERYPLGVDLRVRTTPLTLDGESFTIFTMTDISDEVRRRELERIFFHDLLNAAGIVRTTSELMVDVYSSEIEDAASAIEEGTTMAGLIHRVANRLVREIQSQKAFSQLERDELEVEPEALRSRKLLADLVAGFRMHEDAQGRTLVLAPDTEDVPLFSDRALLARVIENMIKNALEAEEPGETVTVGCRRTEEGVEFWVHNPTVMPERVKRQIFKRAFSTKGAGRGLGTYSMRLISERYLRGRVSFTSDPENGTVFRAAYPLTLAVESAP
jgi:nitrogen fixation/metabolism regulation signal transduction histidine kinase